VLDAAVVIGDRWCQAHFVRSAAGIHCGVGRDNSCLVWGDRTPYNLPYPE